VEKKSTGEFQSVTVLDRLAASEARPAEITAQVETPEALEAVKIEARNNEALEASFQDNGLAGAPSHVQARAEKFPHTKDGESDNQGGESVVNTSSENALGKSSFDACHDLRQETWLPEPKESKEPIRVRTPVQVLREKACGTYTQSCFQLGGCPKSLPIIQEQKTTRPAKVGVAIVTQMTHTQDKFCSLTAAKVGRATELNSNTIKTFLDSGASEFMFTNESYAVGLEKYDTKIETARKGEFILGSRAGNVDAFLKDGKTKLGLKNKAIFSESFSDNLSSVGRLCETGVVCVFFKGKSVIFSEKDFHVSGEILSEEPRDPVTGLYPLILLKGATGAAGSTGASGAPRVRARLIHAADMKNLTPSDWRLVDRRRTELAVEKF
jgi:hypothetical protein